jgi:alpha-tubulin suppressor-like RCC1 family protein
VSFRYVSGINKPGFNPLAAQTSTTLYNLFTWGLNGDGQLGLGNITNYSSPKQVGSFYWTNVSGGTNNSFAVKNDGTLWVWGANSSGQLGLGNTTYYSSPKQVGSLTNWSYMTGGAGPACFGIKTDGTLWSWGSGNAGALGLGNITNYSSPKQIGSLTTWSKIAFGLAHCIAVNASGQLFAWGANSNGQLGLGNTTDRSSPVQVGALTNWQTVACGFVSSFAVKTDGTIWCWGNNAVGQLGLNNRTNYSSPKQIGALTTWLRVAGGPYYAMAVKTDGTLWAIGGENASGQMGLNNTTEYSSPKQVGSLTTWLNIACGGQQFTFASKTDGTLWSWGRGTEGQLGLGNTTSYSSPKQVGSLTTWGAFDAGTYFAIAQG